MSKSDQPAGVALTEGLGRAVPGVPWRPAATIPQDGTRVLAYFPRHPFDEDENMNEAIDLGGVMAVTWKSGNGWVEPDYMAAIGGWFGDDCCYAPAPTHWMPLPAGPNAKLTCPPRAGHRSDDEQGN